MWVFCWVFQRVLPITRVSVAEVSTFQRYLLHFFWIFGFVAVTSFAQVCNKLLFDVFPVQCLDLLKDLLEVSNQRVWGLVGGFQTDTFTQ